MSNTITIIGCGWLGNQISERLISKGHTVIGTARTERSLDKIKQSGAEAVMFDVDSEELDIDFISNKIIIALPPSKVDLDQFGKFVRKLSDDTNQIILISSTGIYKDSNQNVTENSKEIKTEGTLYSIERALGRRFGKNLTILRSGGLIGPGRSPANFLKSEKMLQNPRGRVNLVHSEDCVNIIEKLLDKNVTNKCYNLVMDDHPTKKEFYNTVAFNAGKKEPEFLSSNKRYFKIINNERIKRDLDYRFMDIFDVIR